MPDTLAIDLNARVAWLFQESLDLSTVTDNSNLEYKKSLSDGAGADQADKIWHDTRTLAAGASDDLDLTALANTVYGSTVTINLAKVAAILLVNTSSVAGDKLWLDSSVANAYTGPFAGSATSKVEIGADSPLLLVAKKDTFGATSAGNRVLRVTNPGSNSVTYKIVVLGRSV